MSRLKNLSRFSAAALVFSAYTGAANASLEQDFSFSVAPQDNSSSVPQPKAVPEVAHDPHYLRSAQTSHYCGFTQTNQDNPISSVMFIRVRTPLPRHPKEHLMTGDMIVYFKDSGAVFIRKPNVTLLGEDNSSYLQVHRPETDALIQNMGMFESFCNQKTAP